MQDILKAIAALALLTLSCEQRHNDFRLREFASANKTYCTNDIKAAESEMRQHYHRLADWRAQEVAGIDYDVALAEVSGRLFLIYDKMGDSTNAEVFFKECTKYLNRRRISIGRKPLAQTREELKKEIDETWDSGLNVSWKQKQ